MCKPFYIDLESNINISYQDLLNDINKTDSFSLYCNSKDYYSIFKHIVLSLIIDKEIIILDSDFSDSEIDNLIGDKEQLNSKLSIDTPTIKNKEDLVESIQKTEKWKITLFTSGTTGTPKKVSHTFSSITRFVRYSSKHLDDIWGFAYNPTHIAGVQVFFQCFMNKNTIVRIFNISKDNIFNSINKYSISHVSATPTFYRLLLPLEEKYPTVKRLTFGGEKYDKKISKSLLKYFSNAKITNVYASTEAGTLFASEGEVFSFKEEYRDIVKIENDEILIHKSIMGDSSSLELNNDWYSTGDLIDVVSKEPLKFKFLSRKNEMINTGGYKVNPHEVEEELLSIEGIKEVIVYGKSNSVLGNIVCADIVAELELSVKDVRSYLLNNLQEFKVPRVIKFVENIEKTRTGKTKR